MLDEPTGGWGPDADLAEARTKADEAQSFVRHELRTPLAVLQPVLDMLIDGTAGDLEARQRDYVAMLERNVTRLAAMITSLVETGWLEVAALPAREERVELLSLLRHLSKEVVGHLGAAPPIDVREGPSDEDPSGTAPAVVPPVAVRADPHRLRLALRNVLVNACRFTPPTGSVVVSVARLGDRAVVQVSDTGVGISAEESLRVFEFGYQGSAAQEQLDRGLGLGLFVTRALAESMGGTARLSSEVGSGTTVVVDLPAAP